MMGVGIPDHHHQCVLLFLVVFHLLLVFVVVSQSSLSTSDQIRSLLEFKKGIQQDPLGKIFDSWNVSSDPNTPATPCSFYGVSCDGNGNVVSISLDGLGLSGDLKFSTLTVLQGLTNLTLSGNQLTGRLVPSLGSIYSLQHLDLSGNLFYGPIPAKINDLYGLVSLNLAGNNFSGGYPDGIRNLQQLRLLDLHSNGLWGEVQDLFLELRNVNYVDLSDNGFYGALSSMSVQNLSSLANTVQYVNISGNRLSGGFLSPDSIALFRNLQVLDLGDNLLTGELPSFRLAFPNLQVLRLGNNQFNGLVPQELFQSFMNVQELDLSRNSFSGPIPIINSTTLGTLNLSSNGLSGSLPPSMGNCVIVDLSKNFLSDEVSVMQNWESPLQVLDLNSNNLTGSFPNLTSQLQSLTILNLSNNTLGGSLPPIMQSCPKLSLVDLSLNSLVGPLPATFFTSMTLTNLNLSGNKLTGPIPLQGSHTQEELILPSNPPMEYLDLSDNFLTGTLPSEIVNFRALILLNVGDNQLSGMLPNELNNLSGLEYLDLSRNTFKGQIPDRLSSSLKVFNVSYNELSGQEPQNLRNFPYTSFRPGNPSLVLINVGPQGSGVPSQIDDNRKHHSARFGIKIAIILASVGSALMIAFVLLAYYGIRSRHFHPRSAFGVQKAGRDVKERTARRPTSFSNDHLLTMNSGSLSAPTELNTDIVEPVPREGLSAGSASMVPNLLDNDIIMSGRKSSPGSPMTSSPRLIDALEQPVTLDVYSPDRLAGELFFLDVSLAFTAEELSRAPAEVLGRSSHGTLYKATLRGEIMLTVKWLRVGLVKQKKDFAKEVKKIGSMNHPNIVPLRAYYWGPREQERLILADYIHGDSLALHLYETTPRRYTLLSFNQRLKVAVDVTRCLCYLHDRGMPHGNLKPTNIILQGPDYNARLTDYCLHRLMTPSGISEQLLNLGALGYRAPELANTAKPVPSFKADVYALGVILMELLTRKSAGDIISGQLGLVDLTDWVRLCDREGRGMDCIDRDIAGGEEHVKAMDDLRVVSLRCILPVHERPSIRQIYEDICSITV